MSNLNPPDPTKNHPDKIASNNKVIVLSMKNMPSFKFDPSKNFLANTDATGQSVFNFKPQQLVQTSPQSAQKVQIGQQTSPIGVQKVGTPGTILIRAQASGVVNKPQFTTISNCPNVKIQETSVKGTTNVNKEVASIIPQTITTFRKKSTNQEITMKTTSGHTVLIQPSPLAKPQGATVQVPRGLKGITISTTAPTTLPQLKQVVSANTLAVATNLIGSNVQAVLSKVSPAPSKTDQQQKILMKQLCFPSGKNWTMSQKGNSLFLEPVPALTLLQPKTTKVEMIHDTTLKNANVENPEVELEEIKSPEKSKRTSEEDRLLKVKRIIEVEQDDIEIAEKDVIPEIEETFEKEPENDTEEPLTSEEMHDSSSSMLLCDEKIENVSPETEKSKDVPATPAETDDDNKNIGPNPSVKDVRKNLSRELSLECDKENIEVAIDEESRDESMSNDSSMTDVQRQNMQDYEEPLLKSHIAKSSSNQMTSAAPIIQGKAKRIRKPKNPTIIATLGLPYKPSQPSSRKSKIERKLEFELDFHDPLNNIQWDDGIGGLDNCNKLFGFDEFGLIEVLGEKDAMAKLTQLDVKCVSKGVDDVAKYKLRKIVDPIDMFVCVVCAKPGTIRDFYCPECCSEACLAITKRKTNDTSTPIGKESSSESGVSTPIDERKLMFMGEMVPLQQLQQHLLEQQLPESKRNRSNKRLPFISMTESKFLWENYLTAKSVPAPVKLFKNPYPHTQNPFKVGMKLEAIDPANQKLFCVATVEEKLGYRIKLHFDGYSTAFDFWVNADSPNIFPSGFCHSTGRHLETPPKWSGKKFDWSEYLDYSNSIGALRALFPRTSCEIADNPFEIGMKLETLRDEKLYAASIIDVLEDRVLVSIDGHEDLGCNWLHIQSPYLHPCNYHKTLEDPEGFIPPTPGPFDWNNYLKATNSKEAPSEYLYFRTRAPYEYEPGLKLEVVDRVNRQLIRPATVLCRSEYKVQVIFDGFDINFAYWLDDDSEDLHPINWCEKTCHPIEHPAGFSKSPDNELCVNTGCRGIGNGLIAENYFHDNVQECPYLPSNWKKLLNQKPKSHIDSRITSKRNSKQVSAGGLKRVSNNEVKNEFKYENEIPMDNFDDEAEEDSESIAVEKLTKKKAVKRKAPAQAVDETVTNKMIKIEVAKSFLEDYGPQLNYAHTLWKKNSKVLNRATIGGSLTINPLDWTCENVCSFISTITNDVTIKAKFKEQEIDGAAFLCLHQDDLVNLLNVRLGSAVKIYNRILHLRQETMLKFLRT